MVLWLFFLIWKKRNLSQKLMVYMEQRDFHHGVTLNKVRFKGPRQGMNKVLPKDFQRKRPHPKLWTVSRWKETHGNTIQVQQKPGNPRAVKSKSVPVAF